MKGWCGWAGRILTVDLTTGRTETQPLSRDWARKYVGGRGFGVRYLFDEVSPDLDPLSPRNVIMVAPGVLDGTLSPGSGRCTIAAKSPVTGILGRSSVGGSFGTELKLAGYDMLVVHGVSNQPVYLRIVDELVQVCDARHLWGKDTWTTQAMIQEELNDPEASVIKIGPAGENLCRSSAIIGDLSRAAAKCGIGAVWGSKKLKAIAVRGNRGVRIANPRRLVELARMQWLRFEQDPMYNTHVKYGRNSWVGDTVMRAMGKVMPNISATALYALYEKNVSCRGCALRCAHYYNLRTGIYAGTKGSGIEGNCQLVGASLGVDDGAFLLHYNTLCNRLGVNLDTPSVSLSWAMRLQQDGIISEADADGLDLKPGNQDAFLRAVEMIAYRRGFGHVLDGYPLQAAQELNRGSEAYVSHAKGSYASGPGFMSSVKTTLAHAVATRGHDHLTGSPGIETPNYQPEMTLEVLEKLGRERYGDAEMLTDPSWTCKPKFARRVFDCENLYAIGDMTGICRAIGQSLLYTTGLGMQDYSELLTAATGVDFSPEELVQAGERQMALERAFNAREGIRRIDDHPHAFWWQLKYGQPNPTYDPSRYRMSLADYEQLLDEYYCLRGCDPETGIPTRSTLKQLGLADVATDLEQRGLPLA
ncbi:MAG: aldehyde ferredoxin oxidoreductase N-terminal domain-containing protein [Chloroflexota bacterium]